MRDYRPGDKIGTATVKTVIAAKYPSLPCPRGPHGDGVTCAEPRGGWVEDGEPVVFVAIPLRTVSLSNTREHWSKRNSRSAAERVAVGRELRGHAEKLAMLASGCVVTLTRIGPRLLDDDNLPGAFKAVRDAVAQMLFGGSPGQYDSDKRATWVYQQASLGAGKYGITIGITRK